MLVDFMLASLHHLFVVVLIAALSVEVALVRSPFEPDRLKRLLIIDALYGVSAGLLFVVGVGRLIWGLKGWDYYAGNHAFWVKMALFIVIGLLSIRPTLVYRRWQRAVENGGQSPSGKDVASIRRYLHLQASLLLMIPIIAAAMARGLG
jgi:putative membrane protein